MPTWLTTLLKVVRFAWDNREAIKKAVDPEPEVKGTPLSHQDVERIQAQIRASRPKPPPLPPRE